MQKKAIYKEWQKNKQRAQKMLAVLIDPDKAEESHLELLVQKANEQKIDFFFVGGSLLSKNTLDTVIHYLKINTETPVVLFPGNTMQINLKADGILLLSLISGRNPELLIGKHVEAASLLMQSSLEIISTGYMLVDSTKNTSVSYMSNTKPLPRDKAEIALSTAWAGQMLGLQCNYLEAGSGAPKAVPQKMIKLLSTKTNTPLIVGGGIKDIKTAKKILNAGADIIVVGNKIEKDKLFIDRLSEIVHHQKTSV